MKLKKGMTLFETMIAISIGTTFAAGLLKTGIEHTKEDNVKRFIKESYNIVRAVDHRIAIDGYDPSLWNQMSWASEDEIINGLIKKELTSKFLTSCDGGEWEPSANSEHETKLIDCNQWDSRRSNNEEMKANIELDAAGFIQNFNLYIAYPNQEDFTKNYLNIKKAINKIEVEMNQELTGSHYIDFVSKSSLADISSNQCMLDFDNCMMKFSIDRNGGNEYLRADGENSMIAEHLTFVETKGQAPMECVRWVNTNRDGSGTWQKKDPEDCGIGIYKNDPHPIMVDVVADTGTFKNILLDQECKIYGWNGTDVVDTGNTSPCGIINDSTTTEMIQVINKIQAKKTEVSEFYAGRASINDMFINDIVAETITSNFAIIENQLKTDIIISNRNAGIEIGSDLNLKEILRVSKDIYVDGKSYLGSVGNDTYIGGNAVVAQNQYVTGEIEAIQDIVSLSSIVSTKELKLAKINSENASCSTNGAISRTSAGALLSCVSGKWESAIKASMPVGSIVLWGSSSIPADWIEMNGQSTAKYPSLRAIIGNNVPDMRGTTARGWDHGRGLDSGRALKSYQADALQQMTGSAGFGATGGGNYAASGVFRQQYYRASEKGGNKNGTMITFDASRVARTAAETRMKNVALMYIIKAK